MRIFALETDLRKIEAKFLSPGEEHIITAFYHWFTFFLAVLKHLAITTVIIALVVVITLAGAPWEWVTLIALALWLILVPYPLLKRYIDWKFDFLFMTTDKVIIVDQSSIFKQKITQMNLENFASVTSETQFWNIFPFGKVHFHLKEGVGKEMKLKYIPEAADVADKIADAVTALQRRRSGKPVATQKPMPATPLLTTAKDMAVMGS